MHYHLNDAVQLFSQILACLSNVKLATVYVFINYMWLKPGTYSPVFLEWSF